MTKQEYLNELDNYLHRLPREDYEDAMAYFSEYLEDAGEDMDAVVAELGTPKEAAADLIHNLLDGQLVPVYERDEESAASSEKKSSNVWKMLWIGVLALLAAPIGLPLLLCAIALVFTGVVIIGVLALSGVCTIFGTFLAAIKFFARGLLTLTVSIPGALLQIGVGLFLIGLCILLAIAIVLFCRWFGHVLVAFIKKIANRGRQQ